MKTKLVLIACLFAALALAGCTTAKSKDTVTHLGTSNSPPSSPTLTTTGTGPIATGYPKTVQWDSCKGWDTGFHYPPGKPPGATHDPNWTDPTVNVFTTVITRARDCDRVSWGPFERPVRMILEQHDFLQVPESCQPANNVTGFVGMTELSSLWVNDSALANFLKQTYPGMPVYYSPIDVSDQATGGLIDHVWTWGLEAQNKSKLNTLEDSAPPGQSSDNYRLFWYSDTGVSFMDLTDVFSFPAETNRATYGTVYPPMLWGHLATNYASYGDWEGKSTMSGTISVFHDHQCKQPV
jgi:hypothetical protein